MPGIIAQTLSPNPLVLNSFIGQPAGGKDTIVTWCMDPRDAAEPLSSQCGPTTETLQPTMSMELLWRNPTGYFSLQEGEGLLAGLEDTSGPCKAPCTLALD